ncbi:MAG: Fic family protein [Bacteroidales bacterium]|nr:Fic family protein [Bacteroidales bacterium]
MTTENRDRLLNLLKRHRELGIAEQIDYEKFYLYSIIVHSTAIEGSTVTEVEAQLLFDEGITSSRRTLQEQQMNLDLKIAYDYGREWIKRHEPITVDWLVLLSSKVMAHTGSEYSALGGNFSSAKGELRKLNVSAGIGGKSYMSYLKVPEHLAAFCEELNRRRKAIDATDICAVYDLSFWAHYELVTIHPWADGNGRTSRLLMNLLQMEFDILPTKVLKEDKASYIQALIDTRENEDITIFQNYMATIHAQHTKTDIDQYLNSTNKTTQKSLIATQKELSTTQKNILNYLKKHPQATRQEVAEALGDISENGIKYHFSRLQKSGYLKRQGGRKLGSWIVNVKM